MRTIRYLLCIGLAAATLTGCSLSQRHKAVIADQTISTGLFAFQDAEMLAYNAGYPGVQKTDAEKKATHQAINKALAVALTNGDAFNRTVRAWQPGGATPPELATYTASLGQLATALKDSLPDGTLKSQLGSWIIVAQQAALAVISNLPQKGTARNGPDNGRFVDSGRLATVSGW